MPVLIEIGGRARAGRAPIAKQERPDHPADQSVAREIAAVLRATGNAVDNFNRAAVNQRAATASGIRSGHRFGIARRADDVARPEFNDVAVSIEVELIGAEREVESAVDDGGP